MKRLFKACKQSEKITDESVKTKRLRVKDHYSACQG